MPLVAGTLILGGCSTDDVPRPRPIARVSLAVDDDFACQVRASRRVACRGANSSGQLGDGSERPSKRPRAVVGLALAAAVSVGSGHACALTFSGRAKCWGSNSDGQIGDGTGGVEQASAIRSVATTVKDLPDATAIAAGDGFSCAVLADGHVSCWGAAGFGVLGEGARLDHDTDNAAYRLTAAKVPGISEASKIDAGNAHLCVIVSGGRVMCWGYNGYGQLDGRGADGPTRVPGVTGATAIAAGLFHTCAVVERGRVMCWGDNGGGQLGVRRGRGHPRPGTMPVVRGVFPAATVPGVSNARVIVAGDYYSCALLDTGRVSCWSGGRAVRRRPPVTIERVSRATAIAGAEYRACALLPIGRQRCFEAPPVR